MSQPAPAVTWRAAVVYESMMSATEAIARSVAAGLAVTGGAVTLDDTRAVWSRGLPACDLLVVGPDPRLLGRPVDAQDRRADGRHRRGRRDRHATAPRAAAAVGPGGHRSVRLVRHAGHPHQARAHGRGRASRTRAGPARPAPGDLPDRIHRRRPSGTCHPSGDGRNERVGSHGGSVGGCRPRRRPRRTAGRARRQRRRWSSSVRLRAAMMAAWVRLPTPSLPSIVDT